MDSCVLIPEEFSLVLTLHPNPKNILEMSVAVWSNTFIPAGTIFRPDEGVFKLDKIEVFSKLPATDVSLTLVLYIRHLLVTEKFLHLYFICLKIYSHLSLP